MPRCIIGWLTLAGLAGAGVRIAHVASSAVTFPCTGARALLAVRVAFCNQCSNTPRQQRLI